MKKVKNLEVNLKKLVAIGASILTIGTMAGCAKTEIKEEITQNPVATQPQEEPEVVVDPNAPLFDITDEEVFNQKVDELFNEIKNLKKLGTDNLLNREDAERIILLLNINNLSEEQYSKLDASNLDCYVQYLNSINATVLERIDNKTSISYANYSSDIEFVKILKEVDTVINNYNETGQVTESDIEVIDGFIKKYTDAANDKNRAAIPLDLAVISSYRICCNFEKAAGTCLPQKDEMYQIIIERDVGNLFLEIVMSQNQKTL